MCFDHKMGLAKYAAIGALLFLAFAYFLHEFPDAKKAINETLGCFSSFRSPLSSPICAVIDFGGVAVVGKYVARAVRQGREAVQALREGKSVAQAVREAKEVEQGAREAREAAQGAREAGEAAQGLREAAGVLRGVL